MSASTTDRRPADAAGDRGQPDDPGRPGRPGSFHRGSQDRHSRRPDRPRPPRRRRPSATGSARSAACSPPSITMNISPSSSGCATTTSTSIPRSSRMRGFDQAAHERAYADLLASFTSGAHGRELRRDVARGDRGGASPPIRHAGRDRGAARRFPRGAVLPARPPHGDARDRRLVRPAQARHAGSGPRRHRAARGDEAGGRHRRRGGSASGWRATKLRPGSVLIKYFRNIASIDLNALFPNVRVVLSLRDKLLLSGPALAGGVPIL